MFEFHGWAVIQVPDVADEAERARVFEFVAAAVRDAQDGFSLLDLASGGNGLVVLRLHGLRNHRRDEALDLFRRVAGGAPASYGILYVYDPESERDNEFRTFRMARGVVEEFEDSILSPRYPTIEDEY